MDTTTTTKDEERCARRRAWKETDESFWEAYYKDACVMNEKVRGETTTSIRGYDWFFSYKDLTLSQWKILLMAEEEDEEGQHKKTPRDSSPPPRILHVGSGHSALPVDMYNAGWTRTVATDSSETVIRVQNRMFPKGVRWMQADVRNLSRVFEDDIEKFDVVLDKAVADALLCYARPEVALREMFREVRRVLRPGGRCVVFTSKRSSTCGMKGSALVTPYLREAFGDEAVTERVLPNPREKGGICPEYDWHRVDSYVAVIAVVPPLPRVAISEEETDGRACLRRGA